ncbi:response regulator transcription factor [Tenacibaculum sp. SG-28]|uniref:response regulator transcription factor n=1 Tax=Tenacibaculum sp. SG-28 TaxID=754426 RepID=UPI000CF40848|nr:response regulator transcription factor [Tenacibaculum sp. SG-28]PQJ21548.1 DNA-binding response regulator [Tenacibaculum sp. SG-28]
MEHSVVIVDNHVLLSQAIEAMINSFEKFKVLYTCKDVDDLANKFKISVKNIPAIVLIDVNMPLKDGVQITQWLVENFPKVHVMAMSAEDNDNTILKMLKAGAVGYLLKNAEKDILQRALLQLVENGFYHSKEVTDLLVNSLTDTDSNSQVTFKKNELKFMRFACSELTYKEIAEKMFLSPKTIDGYRDSLFTKLEVRNRVGLVMYAIKNKIYMP